MNRVAMPTINTHGLESQTNLEQLAQAIAQIFYIFHWGREKLIQAIYHYQLFAEIYLKKSIKPDHFIIKLQCFYNPSDRLSTLNQANVNNKKG